MVMIRITMAIIRVRVMGWMVVRLTMGLVMRVTCLSRGAMPRRHMGMVGVMTPPTC